MFLPPDDITIQTAEVRILPQVKRFFRAQGFRAQAPAHEHIVIALLHNRLLAALRMSPLQEHWLLRSMCVDEHCRRMGLGRRLLDHCGAWMERHSTFCFAYPHLEIFYRHGGFIGIDETKAPAIVTDRFRIYRAQGKQLVLMKYDRAAGARLGYSVRPESKR